MAQPPFEAVKRPGRRVGETESISFLVQAAQDLRKKHPLIVATYDLIYNAAQFAGKGFGYVITLDRLINTAGDSNLCFKPLFPTLEAELCIVWEKIRFFREPPMFFLTS